MQNLLCQYFSGL